MGTAAAAQEATARAFCTPSLPAACSLHCLTSWSSFTISLPVLAVLATCLPLGLESSLACSAVVQRHAHVSNRSSKHTLSILAGMRARYHCTIPQPPRYPPLPQQPTLLALRLGRLPSPRFCWIIVSKRASWRPYLPPCAGLAPPSGLASSSSALLPR